MWPRRITLVFSCDYATHSELCIWRRACRVTFYSIFLLPLARFFLVLAEFFFYYRSFSGHKCLFSRYITQSTHTIENFHMKLCALINQQPKQYT